MADTAGEEDRDGEADMTEKMPEADMTPRLFASDVQSKCDTYESSMMLVLTVSLNETG